MHGNLGQLRLIFHILAFYIFMINSATIPAKVLICGVCKNVDKQLNQTISIVESIGSMFEDYRVIVYENNSTDLTPSMLKQWTFHNSKISAFSENIEKSVLSQSIINCDFDPRTKDDLFRPELIARARNIVLEKAMSEEYENYPYIIWMDFDFKIFPNLEGIKEVFLSAKEWDAVFANGILVNNGDFYDWYALRDTTWPLGPEVVGDDWWYGKQRSLDLNSDWYPVYSAFGGCGIYKRSSLKGCRYSALVTSDLEKLILKILSEDSLKNNFYVRKYWDELKRFHTRTYLPQPAPFAELITDPLVGVVIRQEKNPVVFRMSGFTCTYQYPVVCEHVTLHASMIINGHDKLYINPRMTFNYIYD